MNPTANSESLCENLESTGVTMSNTQFNVFWAESCHGCSFYHESTMNPTAQSESHRENRADTKGHGSMPQMRQDDTSRVRVGECNPNNNMKVENSLEGDLEED